MIIELVLLKIRSNVSELDFLRAAEAATLFLSECDGFIRRRLAESDDGDWVDYIEWQALDDALAAAKRFNQAPETREFNDAIEPGSVVMRHLVTRHLMN
jgi:hypothetical protein